MGNSGSNNNSASHQLQCTSGKQEMGRGWTHSFPRELNRHNSQPPGHKVLPEPPNQRLRATNNGSIIHNGGTISGRRPSALTLPHDLNKGIYRSRSTSASNLGQRSRSSNEQSHCCGAYRSCDSRCRDHEMSGLKRFDSEPDLRYSPNDNFQHHHHRHQQQHQHQPYHHHQQQQQQQQQQQHQNSHQGSSENHHRGSNHPPRESRERESRYRGKKKYKAPAPPSFANEDASSPDSYKWETTENHESHCGQSEDTTMMTTMIGRRRHQPPPPRRSRLFKTRVETKKAQTSCQSSQENESRLTRNETASEWRKNDKYARRISREELAEPENWPRRDEKRRSSQLTSSQTRLKNYDGKNTLQRSLSSPEFQAELMQVARKLREKLNHSCRLGPIGEATIFPSNDRNQCKNYNHEIAQRFSGRKNFHSSERFNETRPARETSNDNRNSKEINEKRYDDSTTRIRKKKIENDDEFECSDRRRIIEESYVYEERIISNSRNELINDEKLPEDSSMMNFFNEKSMRTRQEMRNHRINDNPDERTRTRSVSPAGMRNLRLDARGQGSGRESTPESSIIEATKFENKKNRGTRDDFFLTNLKRTADSNVRRNDRASGDDSKILGKTRISHERETKEEREKNSNGLPPSGRNAPKTYCFGADDGSSRDIGRNEETQRPELARTRLRARDTNDSSNKMENRTDDSKNENDMDDIALKLRPTLPKKQLEIPRFSPSAAWRLLSALETPGPTMSTASEEVPVMFEERIERLARPPPDLVVLDPRSSHDKSGDSGISGDAGAPNDDTLDTITTNDRTKQAKVTRSRPAAWTPQQDLGEESSSDAGVDSPPPMSASMKFSSSRPHVFSLSLPRDENRFCLTTEMKLSKDNNSSFNSLQKLKRSVSGALGLATNDAEERKRSTGETLGENWLLSTSAPNSLQHDKSNKPEIRDDSSPIWENDYSPDVNDPDIDEIVKNEIEKRDFPIIMKPPSFSYLASGGHVMYLPEANDTEHRAQSLNYRNDSILESTNSTNYRKSTNETTRQSRKIGSFGINGISIKGIDPAMNAKTIDEREMGIFRERSFTCLGQKSRKYPNFFKSCENITEMRQRSVSPIDRRRSPENLQDTSRSDQATRIVGKNQKSKRFTFQSTVRQIERRRLAEKLSREAEAKERQRKSELEVMRKVEEEFQRKRAREKANIRQQLRLYSMDENSCSLPPAWESSQLSRDDPDGAPSSSASSPISAPTGKMSNRKSSIGSDEYQHRKRVSESRNQQQQQPAQQREYKDYRPKYYDWAPESSSHLDVKQTTVHPKVVYDMPKSSHVFIDANIHTAKPANVISTPRSDNYRKDFAHGAVAAKSSLASSDSELSQPNTRPHSRQNGNKSKPMRSRSASPARSDGAGSASVHESPVEAVKQERNSTVNGFILNGVQPFVREKSYRPIAFNPRPPPPIPS